VRRPKDAVLAIYEARAFAAAALIVIGVATDILPVVPAMAVAASPPPGSDGPTRIAGELREPIPADVLHGEEHPATRLLRDAADRGVVRAILAVHLMSEPAVPPEIAEVAPDAVRREAGRGRRL
jgi:hypothetical protein